MGTFRLHFLRAGFSFWSSRRARDYKTNRSGDICTCFNEPWSGCRNADSRTPTMVSAAQLEDCFRVRGQRRIGRDGFEARVEPANGGSPSRKVLCRGSLEIRSFCQIGVASAESIGDVSVSGDRIRFPIGSNRHDHASREDGVYRIGCCRRTGAFVDWGTGQGRPAKCQSQGKAVRQAAASGTERNRHSAAAAGQKTGANELQRSGEAVWGIRLDGVSALQKRALEMCNFLRPKSNNGNLVFSARNTPGIRRGFLMQ